MKIQALLIAAALASGAAFAATPNDTATGTVTTKKVTKHHKKVTKTTKTTHTRHVARRSTTHHQNMGASAAPQTDTSDRAREARMDDALAKYRQSH